MKHAYIDDTNTVVSIIIWPNASYKIPKGYRALSVTNATKLGDTFDEDNGRTTSPDGSTVRESVTLVDAMGQ